MQASTEPIEFECVETVVGHDRVTGPKPIVHGEMAIGRHRLTDYVCKDRDMTQFGPYELRSRLGAGGMGEVHEAYDKARDRTLAVKVLRTEICADPEFRERFRREVPVAARIQNPHLIQLLEFGDVDGVLFVAMRRLDVVGSLKDQIRTRGPLDPAEAASIVAQVASALDAAHAEGLVHRDVKPENVLLTADNYVYLADFGVAPPGGSPLYMAPERVSGGRVGPAADVYALTCVLYECLTGVPPFESEQVKGAHLAAPIPRPSIMRRGIDRGFDGVIAKGMAKQPVARFGSAGELAAAATAVVSPEVPGTRPFAVDYPNPEDTGYSPYPPVAPGAVRFGRVGRGPMLLAGLGVLLLVMAALLAVILVFRDGRGSPTPSAPPTTAGAPTLSGAVDGADGLGFIGHSARCDPANPPAMVLRTAKSLVVVCQKGLQSYYYRGERISDGANIEIANVVRASGGFDATNPANGVRYEVRPQSLTIISGSHVDSAEPVLQYASGG